jgi:hypothetical protein
VTDETAGDPIERLRRTRSARTKTPARATARKTRPAPSRPATAKKTAITPGQQLAALIKLGSGVVELKAPVHASILAGQADQLGGILDRLADQDPRVREFLAKIAKLSGGGGAWAELAMCTMATGGALMLASGNHHPLAVMLGGAVATQAATAHAYRIAAHEAVEAGHVDAGGEPIVSAERVQELTGILLAPRAKQPAAEVNDASGDPAV